MHEISLVRQDSGFIVNFATVAASWHRTTSTKGKNKNVLSAKDAQKRELLGVQVRELYKIVIFSVTCLFLRLLLLQPFL